MLGFRIVGVGSQRVELFSRLVAARFRRQGRHARVFAPAGPARRDAVFEGSVRIDAPSIASAAPVAQPDVVVVLSDPALDLARTTRGLAAGGLLLIDTAKAARALDPRLRRFRLATLDASAIAVAHDLGTPLAPLAQTALFGALVRVLGEGNEREIEAVLENEIRPAGRHVEAAIAGYRRVRPPLLLEMRSSGRRTHPEADATLRAAFVPATSPCNAHCPAGNDVRGFLAALGRDDPGAALRVLLRTSPFPGVCGRICPHPCEDDCSRATLDGAIPVRALERFVEAHGGDVWIEPAPPTGRSVAIIGAGPAGLSAAWHLAALGHDVEVFEADPEPGGSLLYAVPRHRLPRDIVRREIRRIAEIGVKIHCGVRVGVDLSPEEIRAEFDALLLAIGRQAVTSPGLPGERLPGIVDGPTFLRQHALGREPFVGDRVVVVGDGETAFDAVGVCMRRSRTGEVGWIISEHRSSLPVAAEDLAVALEEGLRLYSSTSPAEFVADAAGRVAGVRCLGDADAGPGRRTRPEIPCDQVVWAGPALPDPTLTAGLEIRSDDLCTDEPGLFVTGEASGGVEDVATAIGSGRRAALAIQGAMSRGGIERGPWASNRAVARGRLGATRLPSPAWPLPRLPVSVRLRTEREVVGEIADACREAARCLACGTCTGCDACVEVCPESAIARSGGTYRFDLDRCNGCGLCLEACVGGAIRLVQAEKRAVSGTTRGVIADRPARRAGGGPRAGSPGTG